MEKIKDSITTMYTEFAKKGLDLDLTRGKPFSKQLSLSNKLLLGSKDYHNRDEIDCRNYGGLEGLPEARELFAEYLDVRPEEIFVLGNSSLQLMWNVVTEALLKGFPESSGPLVNEKVAFICLTPGYDRHFAIGEHYGIEMIPVPLGDNTMNIVQDIVLDRPDVKGIWCVPKYSNPTGISYRDDMIQRLARMKTAAPDFKIMYDNTYAHHDWTSDKVRLLNILRECEKAGNPNRVFIFGSTSKITFAGAGLGMIASSRDNLEWFRNGLRIQTIGPNKLNQLNHVRFLKNMDGIQALLEEHARFMLMRLDLVDEILSQGLGLDGEFATWGIPKGGYFVSVFTKPGHAGNVIKYMRDVGIRLTEKGAAFPYGYDPDDSHLRLAFSYLHPTELTEAMEGVVIGIKLSVARG